MKRITGLVTAALAVGALVVFAGTAASGTTGKAPRWDQGGRAVAVVVPGEVSLNVDPVLVAPLSRGFRSVSEPALGVYCLTPVRGVDPLRTPLVVAPEYDYSSARSTGLLVSWAIGAKACGAGAFEVRTFTLVAGPTGPVARPSEGVAFVAMTP